MQKIELKHISAYLPYGLKVFRDTGETSEILELSSGKIMLWQDGYYESFKPILRPLSDLTKEIEVNGEKFVPTKALSMWDLEGITIIDIPHIPVNLYELLLKWHFDIFGLIENDLAIDVNTLNK